MRTLYLIVGKRKAGTSFLFHSCQGCWKPSGKDAAWPRFEADIARFLASDAPIGMVAKADALLDAPRLLATIDGLAVRVICIRLERNVRDRRFSFIAHERSATWRRLPAVLAAFEAEEAAYAAGAAMLDQAGVAIWSMDYDALLSGADTRLAALGYVPTQKTYNAKQQRLPFLGAIAKLVETKPYQRLRTSAPMLALKRFYYSRLARARPGNHALKLVVMGSVAGPVDGQRRLTGIFCHGNSFATTLLEFHGHRDVSGPLRIAGQSLRAMFLAAFGRIDFVYVAMSRTNFGLVRELALLFPFFLRGIPVVAHIHGAEFEDYYFRDPGLGRLKRYYLRSLARLIFIHEVYRCRQPDVAGKAVVARNPRLSLLYKADAPVTRRQDITTFGFISSFIPGKGAETFLDVAQQFGDKARFILAGGPNRKFLPYGDTVLQKIQATPAVSYLGLLADPGIFYRDCDVLIFPTTYTSEAAPGVVIEALCLGCGPVVQRSERLCAVFEGSPILWFDDQAQLAAIVAELAASDAASRSRLAAASIAWIEKAFPDERAWVEGLEDILVDAAAATGAKR